MFATSWSSSMIRTCFISRLGKPWCRMRFKVTSEEGLDALELTDSLEGEPVGIGLEALISLALEFAKRGNHAHHAAGGTGAGTAMGEALDFVGVAGGKG